ncbi:MAG TPA: hypothetical protein VIY52_32620 [Streptosporangiaceae bacterium]
MTSDDRFTPELIIDIFDVLEQHGYHRYDNKHTGQAFAMVFDLAYVYDGTRDAPYAAYPGHASPGPHAGPGPSDPDADDSVILTAAEVRTAVGALDVAADYKRDRAAACADCPDQTCPTCQSRLRDAQAYDQMATQMLETAEAARTANSAQPSKAASPVSPRQPHPAADREAGQ